MGEVEVVRVSEKMVVIIESLKIKVKIKEKLHVIIANRKVI